MSFVCYMIHLHNGVVLLILPTQTQNVPSLIRHANLTLSAFKYVPMCCLSWQTINKPNFSVQTKKATPIEFENPVYEE